MQLFTAQEYNTRTGGTIATKDIEKASDQIFAQVSPLLRDKTWTSDTVPSEIKRAALVQAEFNATYEIPDIDYKSEVKAGEMKVALSSKYSTDALTILANNEYLYRGNNNLQVNIPFGG